MRIKGRHRCWGVGDMMEARRRVRQEDIYSGGIEKARV